MASLYGKQVATVHPSGAIVARGTATAAQVTAARLAHYGQLAAGAAARAQVASMLAQAGIAATGHALVGPDRAVIGATTKHAPVDTSGGTGPRGYSGGAYSGLVARGGGTSSAGELLGGLLGLLTGGGTDVSGDFGVSPVDLVSVDRAHDLANPFGGAAARLASPYPPPRPPPIEEPTNIDEGGGFRTTVERPNAKPGKPDPKTTVYDPDSAGGGGYNPFFHPAYSTPKFSGASTGDSEFGGTAAGGPVAGRSGPRLGISLNDAPLRRDATAPSALVAHLPRRWTPGGYSGR